MLNQSPNTVQSTPVPPLGDAGAVKFTSPALDAIKSTREQEGMGEQYGLRVAVRGGGCSGFEYALDFDDEQRPTDELIEFEGLQVFVDPISARYLQGTLVDYLTGMMGSGFKFLNPNASGTCGCGSSFAV